MEATKWKQQSGGRILSVAGRGRELNATGTWGRTEQAGCAPSYIPHEPVRP